MTVQSRERIGNGALSFFPQLPTTPLVSVVIPALNEERSIGACLEAIEGQSYSLADIEVVVADGGSSDRTREIVLLHAATTKLNRIILVENPEQSTPTGLNAGVRESRGAVVVNMIAHVVADRNFIAGAVDVLRESGAAAAGGPVATAPGTNTVIAHGIASALSHPLSVGNATHRFGKSATDTETLYYAAYRRECFDHLGGFDPERLQSEDDTFNLKVRQAGGRLRFDPRIRSTYRARPTYRALARQYFRFGRAKGLVAFAEDDALSARHLAPPAAAGVAGIVGALALVSSPARILVLLGLLSYGLATATVGILTARRRGRPYVGPAAATAFPVIHGSYAMGMLVGLAKGWRGSRS